MQPQNASLQQILVPPPQSGQNNVFTVIFIITVLAFLGCGLYLKTIKPVPSAAFEEKKAVMTQTQFLIAEKKKTPPPKPKAPEVKKDAPKEVIDLTKAPLLNQKTDFTAPEQPKQTTAPARPVYGLRRVFSTGFGAGGTAGDAVIGKVGNTLNKDVDTVHATKQDLKGTVVSISTVSTAPRLKHDVKPQFTKEMIAAKLEGVIKAELLIDIDGKVKEVKILNDLGFGTKEKALEAFLQWEFDPAMRDGKPVATWISYSIRFVLLQE